eukprot:358499-Chlamydomonas_euryale.AAC.3
MTARLHHVPEGACAACMGAWGRMGACVPEGACMARVGTEGRTGAHGGMCAGRGMCGLHGRMVTRPVHCSAMRIGGGTTGCSVLVHVPCAWGPAQLCMDAACTCLFQEHGGSTAVNGCSMHVPVPCAWGGGTAVHGCSMQQHACAKSMGGGKAVHVCSMHKGMPCAWITFMACPRPAYSCQHAGVLVGEDKKTSTHAHMHITYVQAT